MPMNSSPVRHGNVLTMLSRLSSLSHQKLTAAVFATAGVLSSSHKISAFSSFGSPFISRRFDRQFHRHMSSSTSSVDYGQFVSVADAIKLHDDDDSAVGPVAFVDASWHLGATDPDADRKKFEAGPRIAGSIYFDINDVADKEGDNKDLPHMFPSPKLFSAAMDAYGITSAHRIIFYGNDHAALSIPRAAITFRIMGHDSNKIHMMQGDVDDWVQQNGPVETGPLETEKGGQKRSLRVAEDLSGWESSDTASYSGSSSLAANVLTKSDVLSIIEGKTSEQQQVTVLDARSAGRFAGTAPEPRAGLRGGHMPGAVSLPYVNLMSDGSNVAFKCMEEMRTTFDQAGVDISSDKKQKFVVSCGSGVTACHLATGLKQCGVAEEDIYYYDGAWCEWGADPDVPIVT